jgi:hypothetical protein
MVQAEGARITISGKPPHTSYYAYVVWRRRHRNVLAYVPARHAPVVRAWQVNPIVKSLPQWPTWP